MIGGGGGASLDRLARPAGQFSAAGVIGRRNRAVRGARAGGGLRSTDFKLRGLFRTEIALGGEHDSVRHDPVTAVFGPAEIAPDGAGQEFAPLRPANSGSHLVASSCRDRCSSRTPWLSALGPVRLDLPNASQTRSRVGRVVFLVSRHPRRLRGKMTDKQDDRTNDSRLDQQGIEW
jgi:hypothetical protein